MTFAKRPPTLAHAVALLLSPRPDYLDTHVAARLQVDTPIAEGAGAVRWVIPKTGGYDAFLAKALAAGVDLTVLLTHKRPTGLAKGAAAKAAHRRKSKAHGH